MPLFEPDDFSHWISLLLLPLDVLSGGRYSEGFGRKGKEKKQKKQIIKLCGNNRKFNSLSREERKYFWGQLSFEEQRALMLKKLKR